MAIALKVRVFEVLCLSPTYADCLIDNDRSYPGSQ